jgi:hypothetical protein
VKYLNVQVGTNSFVKREIYWTNFFSPLEKKLIENDCLKFVRKKSQKIQNIVMVSGLKSEWATSIGAPFRKLKCFNRKLADSTAGVATNTFPKPSIWNCPNRHHLHAPLIISSSFYLVEYFIDISAEPIAA